MLASAIRITCSAKARALGTKWNDSQIAMVRRVRQWRSAVLGLILVTILTGCAAVGTGGEGAGPGSNTAENASSTPTVETVEDAEANALAQSWLDGAVLPPGAVASETVPTRFLSYYAWPCQPMVERTGYWTVAGASVAETANWLKQNPTGGLIVTTPGSVPDDANYDEVNIGNARAFDSLEGIAYTVSRTADGVAIRAEIGVIPARGECPEGNWGGPGQG